MTYQDPREFEKLLQDFTALRPRERILEIGSMTGETLEHWMTKATRGARIVSVDKMVPESDRRYWLQKDGHEVLWPLIAQCKGVELYVLDRDSRAEHTIQMVRSLLPTIDFLFIDGGHDFETCCLDYQNYGRLVRKGGLIAFHDLGREWPDVRRVWESIKEPGRRWEYCQSPHRYGIGVLEVA